MTQIVARISSAARAAGGYVLRAAGYWLGSGLAGAPRPRMPKRYGFGPFRTTRRYAIVAAFYPVALAAWAIGKVCRPLRCRCRNSVAEAAMTNVSGQAKTVRHLPLLSPVECADIVARVHAMRHMWVYRQPGFFTLGLAAYMDCRNQQATQRYLQAVPALNEALLLSFEPLYEKLIAALHWTLGEPCDLIDGRAIPGFHIWVGAGIPRYGFDVASVHLDLQYLDLGFCENELPTSADVMSFTLPIRLPKAGGGLNVWDIRHPERAGWEVWPFKAVSRVRYSVGSLVLHTGHEVHQIAPVEQIDEGDERICLQGHGIRKDGHWLLYW
jgi:hypothetical protein